ncbi:PiggyBac transposable element-derived protein 4 [Eumeta japonica]|uniref:PiggyBac transposable element-derived protein 4 n=1 Tax=Eumeta variegata TaxID=151549 RepID=A0A4C1TLD3_EUMVA|nr:PiggyBac transposable element-derived protein 4 [Eumeta japonica]
MELYAAHALAVAADRVASARAAAATAAPWTIPFLVAPTPEVLECHRAVSGLRLLEVATGVDEGEVEESEVKVEAKVEAAVEAKAEAEAADLHPPERPSRYNRTTGKVSDYEKRRTAQSTQEAIPVGCTESAPQPASPAIFVPSPAAFVELEGHGNITSPSSIASPSISFRTSRPLNDDEIEEALMFDGSDDDCGEDDNDEIRVPMMLPPYMRLQAEEQTLEEAEDELSPLPPSLPPRMWVDVGAEPSTRSQSEARLVSMVSVGCQTDSPIGPTTAFDMQWNSFPAHSGLNLPEVRRELFQERTGAKSSYATPYDAFVAIWDHTLVEKIVTETNAFASRLLARMTAQGLMRPNSRMSRWKDTTVDEILDESLVQWRGWLCFKQFIKNKAAAVGIKTYEVCESDTGYLWRFEVHAEKLPAEPKVEAEVAGAIPTLVLRLLNGLEYRGHTVWMDNFYNSPALARTLKSKGFDCVGTLRTNRLLVPSQLTDLRVNHMIQDGIYGCTSGDVDIILWRDKRRVSLISTYHGDYFVRGNNDQLILA